MRIKVVGRRWTAWTAWTAIFVVLTAIDPSPQPQRSDPRPGSSDAFQGRPGVEMLQSTRRRGRCC